MKTHGNYSAYTNAKEKDVIFIKRRTLKWFRSSKKAKRGFCKKCGASIFLNSTEIIQFLSRLECSAIQQN